MLVGPNIRPLALLVVKPPFGVAPLAVTADASLSRDADGSIVSYSFDFGDGTIVGPRSSAIATHTYAAGQWVARVTVTDNGGLTASASLPVVVLPPGHGPVLTVAALVQDVEAQELAVTVKASDPDSDAITALGCDLSKLPLGNNARFLRNATNTEGTLLWTPSYDDSGTYRVTFTASNTLATSVTMTLHVNNVDRAPVVSCPNNLHVGPTSTVSFTVTARDPDGDPVASLKMVPFHVPGSGTAVFTSNATHTGGTFVWSLNGLTGNFKVLFDASNALTGSAGVNIHSKLGGDGGPGSGTGEGILAAQETPVTVLALSDAFPNPAHDAVGFALNLPQNAHVRWTVFDLQGRAVWSEDRVMAAGRKQLHWDGTASSGARLATGVYLVRVRVDATEFTRRVVRF